MKGFVLITSAQASGGEVLPTLTPVYSHTHNDTITRWSTVGAAVGSKPRDATLRGHTFGLSLTRALGALTERANAIPARSHVRA